MRVAAARPVAGQQPVVGIGEQGVGAAADQHVDVAQERGQRLLVGKLLQVRADDHLVEAGIGREHPVDLGVDLARQQRDLIAAGEPVDRDVAERADQGVDLRRRADDGDLLAVLDEDRRAGDLVRAGAGLGRGRAGLGECGEVAVAVHEARQGGLAGEVEVGRQVGKLRSEPGVVGGARRGAEIGADDVGDLRRPAIELVIAEHRGLDADDVLDGDVGAAGGGREPAVGAGAGEPVELVVDAVIGRCHLRVGPRDVERARDPGIAGRERDRVRRRIFEPIDDGREVRRALGREQPALPVRGVQDLERVGHRFGLLGGEVEAVLGDGGGGVAGRVREGAGRHDHVVGGSGPQIGARVDRHGVARDRDLRGVGGRDGAQVACAVAEGDAAGAGPDRLAEAQDDVGVHGHPRGVVGRRRGGEDRRGLVEAQADEDGIVVGFPRGRAAVEGAGRAAEIEVVVDRVRLVGVDVPLGDAGDLPIQARAGQGVVERAVGPIEDVGIRVGETVLGEVGEPGRLEDVERVLLEVGVEVAEQERVAVLGARRPHRDPLGQSRGREFALLLPGALAVALVGIRAGPGAALGLEVGDDCGEVLAGGDLVEGDRERGTAGIRAVEEVPDRAPLQQGRVEGRHVRVVEPLDRGVHRHADLARLVDEADCDRVAAEELALVELRARIDGGVGAGARAQVELADEVFQRVAGVARAELVLDLGQAEHVGPRADQGRDELLGLPGEFFRRVRAARLETDRRAGGRTGVERGEVVEDVEAADLERAADRVGLGGARVGRDEAVIAVVDGSHPVGAGRAEAEGAGEPGHGVAHARRRCGGIDRAEAVQILDRLVLGVEAVVVGDRARRRLGEIGGVGRRVRLEFVGEGLGPAASGEADLVEAVEVELLGDREGLGEADQHALVALQVGLRGGAGADDPRRRQLDGDRRGLDLGRRQPTGAHHLDRRGVRDRDLGLAVELGHGAGDADPVTLVDLDEAVAGALEDEDALRGQRVAVLVGRLFLQGEAAEVALGIGVAVLEVADDDRFDRDGPADQRARRASPLHRRD